LRILLLDIFAALAPLLAVLALYLLLLLINYWVEATTDASMSSLVRHFLGERLI
jgi:hypothetical protein